jgi:hypothetical protein
MAAHPPVHEARPARRGSSGMDVDELALDPHPLRGALQASAHVRSTLLAHDQ